MAEGYIEESIEKKKKVCKLLMGEKKIATTSTDVLPSTSSFAFTPPHQKVNLPANGGVVSIADASFQNAQNCSFHFYFSK